MEYRPLTRKKKELPLSECLALLKTEKRGVLSVLGDGGYPYGTPINHFYNEADGRLYFHCGRLGHRLDALRGCDKASFCCVDGGAPAGDPAWALRFRSVIVFGRVAIIDDPALAREIGEKLSRKFTDDEGFISREIERSGPATLILALTPEHICGKIITES